MIIDLIRDNRSFRRFDSEKRIKREELMAMVEGARCSASAANLQRIRYALVTEKSECDAIFQNIAFAGYLKSWGGPTEFERPTAYVVMMAEKEPDINIAIDAGIAAQSMLLIAREIGYGGCMIRSFKKAEVEAILNRAGYSIVMIIALGSPTETVYLTDAKDGDIKYFRDENDNHAVPKLSLDEIVI